MSKYKKLIKDEKPVTSLKGLCEKYDFDYDPDIFEDFSYFTSEIVFWFRNQDECSISIDCEFDMDVSLIQVYNFGGEPVKEYGGVEIDDFKITSAKITDNDVNNPAYEGVAEKLKEELLSNKELQKDIKEEVINRYQEKIDEDYYKILKDEQSDPYNGPWGDSAKVKFKDGTIVEVSDHKGVSKENIIKEAKEVYKEFKDALSGEVCEDIWEYSSGNYGLQYYSFEVTVGVGYVPATWESPAEYADEKKIEDDYEYLVSKEKMIDALAYILSIDKASINQDQLNNLIKENREAILDYFEDDAYEAAEDKFQKEEDIRAEERLSREGD